MQKQTHLLDQELTYAVIGAFHNTYNNLGAGFLENVYVGALMIELQKLGLHTEREIPIAVQYDGVIIGTYRIDILVEHRLVLEIKTALGPKGQYEKQLRNYLRCSDLELGLVLVFDDTKPVHLRVIDSRQFKLKRAAASANQR